jgi:ABC-type nitrate/sulfonate/bicarbonate transport system substrate-binding protein
VLRLTNLRFLQFFTVDILLVGHLETHAAAPLAKIMMTAASASERDGVIYVAQDLGLFRKYGLDLTFVQVRNGPVAMSASSSGETQFHWGSVSGANLGAIAEGADLVFVAGFHQSTVGYVRLQSANQNAR